MAAFDKTGTITEGKPQVDDIISYDFDEDKLVQYVMSVENNSQHPIAKAIVNKANDLNIELISTEDFENITGKGIKSVVDDKQVLVGNLSLLNEKKN